MPIGDNIIGDWLYGDQTSYTSPIQSNVAIQYLVDLELTTGTEYISHEDLNDIIVDGESRQYKRMLLDISAIVESLPSNDYGVSQLSDITLKLANNKGYFSSIWNNDEWRGKVVRIRRWDGTQVTASWRGVITDTDMIDEATVSVRFKDPSDLQVLLPRRTVSTEDWTPKVSIVAASGGSLTANTTYSYIVFAYGSDDTILGKSEQIQGTTGATTKKLVLTWDTIDGASYYRVFGNITLEKYWEVVSPTYTDDGSAGTTKVIPNMNRASIDLGKAYGIGIGENATDVPIRCINENFTDNVFDYICYGETTGGSIIVHKVKRSGQIIDPSEYTVLSGSNSPYNGFLCIRFALQQLDFNNNYYDITVDMSRTVQAADTYGFIQNIAFLLSDPVVGAGKNINSDNFDVAEMISRVSPLKCSFVLKEQKSIENILDDFLWCVGAYLDVNSEGEYEIFVDQVVAGTTMGFDVLGEKNRYKTNMKSRKRTSLQDAINTFVLEYRKQINGSSENYALKTSSRTVNGYGKDAIHQTDCVRDKETADRIACYWANKWKYNDEKIHLECGKHATVLRRYQTIRFVNSLHGLDDVYQVEEINGELNKADLLCSHYDDAIFTYTPGVLPDDPV